MTENEFVDINRPSNYNYMPSWKREEIDNSSRRKFMRSNINYESAKLGECMLKNYNHEADCDVEGYDGPPSILVEDDSGECSLVSEVDAILNSCDFKLLRTKIASIVNRIECDMDKDVGIIQIKDVLELRQLSVMP